MCFHVGTHVLECMCGSLRTIYKDIENKQTNKNKKEKQMENKTKPQK